jgi:hypothetical protein
VSHQRSFTDSRPPCLGTLLQALECPLELSNDFVRSQSEPVVTTTVTKPREAIVAVQKITPREILATLIQLFSPGELAGATNRSHASVNYQVSLPFRAANH